MEKVVYLVWREQSVDAEQFSTNLRTDLADRLLALGARGLQVNVQDGDVAEAAGLRLINTRPQPEAMVSVWVDCAVDALRRPFDKAVANVVPRMAAYLVSESTPIRNTLHPPGPRLRTEGWFQVALLGRPPRLPPETWRDIWQNSHTQVAVGTQSTFLYVQNFVIRVLSYSAPVYDAIVEEGFPAAAMTDTYSFFDAVGDEAKYHRNHKAMIDSCQRFIDRDRIDVLPTSQYLIKELGK
ncbi:MAG: EthD domain-containing protein [Betaproteobacteria bacterium]|nr:EthD domain-containing protein [Betaproteobacteria bacterium]